MPPNKPAIYTEYVPDDQGREQLQAMVFCERHGPRDLLVPPRVRPDLAREYLRGAVKPGIKSEAVEFAADVARFYNLRDVHDRFLDFLQRRERNANDVMRSINCLRLLGECGNVAEQNAAGGYFDYLVQHSLFDEVVEMMIECWFHLDGVNESVVADKLKAEMEALKRKAADPKSPGRDHNILEEHLENTLVVTSAARKHKQTLMGEKDPLKRATGIARAYVGLDDPAGIEWPKWAGFEIMSEINRTSADNAVAALQAALAAIKPDDKPEFVEFARSRGAKAVVFLGGKLNDDQTAWPAYGKTRRFQLEG